MISFLRARVSNERSHLCDFAGLLQEEHTETNRVPLSARRQMPGDKTKQESLPVL
jgi:hypothetical protein